MVIVCALFLFFYLRSWYRQRIASAELRLERANAELAEREDNLLSLRDELARVKDEKERQRLAGEVEQAERDAEEQRKVVISSQEKLDELRRQVRTSSKTLRQQYCTLPLFRSLLQKVRDNSIATEQDYEEIQQALAARDAEQMRRFYGLLPNPSETEVHVFLLLRFGMTKTEVGLLTAHSQAAVTNTCTRLFQKVHGQKCSTSAEAYEWMLGL